MSKEIGPREKALREMREQQFARSAARPAAKVGALREKVAAIPARKPKAEKKKRGAR